MPGSSVLFALCLAALFPTLGWADNGRDDAEGLASSVWELIADLMKLGVFPSICFFFAVLSTSPAWAHGGAGRDVDPCVQRMGRYVIHFTAYQPQFNPSAEYCKEVPKAGQTILVFDLVDVELRTTPVAIRVVDAAYTSEPRTVLEIPAKTYPNGVVNAEANFDPPGRYMAIITVQEPASTVSFPLRVGMWSAKVVLAAGLLLVGTALYYVIGHKKGWPLPFGATPRTPKVARRQVITVYPEEISWPRQ